MTEIVVQDSEDEAGDAKAQRITLRLYLRAISQLFEDSGYQYHCHTGRQTDNRVV